MAARRLRALTLVELLVVLALLSLLAAILFPVFASARRKADETTCRSNLRQIGQGLRMYRADWELPPWWIHHLYPSYVTSAALYSCPADPFLKRGGWSWENSWMLFVDQPTMGLRPPRFPVSYVDDGFMRQPTRRRVLMSAPGGSYTACVLHGDDPRGNGCYHGKVLRLGFDGAVQVAQVPGPPNTFNWCKALCDEPYPEVP